MSDTLLTNTKMKYTSKCTCGAGVESNDLAIVKRAALGHIDSKTSAHVVTCTRPAHGNPNSVGVIVFIANPEKHPHIMQYSAEKETVRLPKRTWNPRLGVTQGL